MDNLLLTFYYTSFLEGAGGDFLPGFAGPGARLMVMDLDGSGTRPASTERLRAHIDPSHGIHEYLQIVRLGYA